MKISLRYIERSPPQLYTPALLLFCMLNDRTLELDRAYSVSFPCLTDE